MTRQDFRAFVHFNGPPRITFSSQRYLPDELALIHRAAARERTPVTTWIRCAALVVAHDVVHRAESALQPPSAPPTTADQT